MGVSGIVPGKIIDWELAALWIVLLQCYSQSHQPHSFQPFHDFDWYNSCWTEKCPLAVNGGGGLNKENKSWAWGKESGNLGQLAGQSLTIHNLFLQSLTISRSIFDNLWKRFKDLCQLSKIDLSIFKDCLILLIYEGLRLLPHWKNMWLRMIYCLQIIWWENRKFQWRSWSATILHREDMVQAGCD